MPTTVTEQVIIYLCKVVLFLGGWLLLCLSITSLYILTVLIKRTHKLSALVIAILFAALGVTCLKGL